jgi:hypothetical protein
LSTYRSASESLHPAHAEVHFNMYSSLGISAMVSNSCSNGEKIGEREKAIVDLPLHIGTDGEKSIRSGPIKKWQSRSGCPELEAPLNMACQVRVSPEIFLDHIRC